MFLIVGLGNPEPSYNWTRHNIGFEVINKLGFDNNISITKQKKNALIGTGTINGHKVILAKPQTYMNLSGESILPLLKYYEINKEHLVIIHDEIALEICHVRLKYGGGAGGHNGIKNVISHLKTGDFLRLRIGIGSKPPGFKLSNYVLSRFLPEEHNKIVEGVTKASNVLEYFLNHGKEKTMNEFNRKTLE